MNVMIADKSTARSRRFTTSRHLILLNKGNEMAVFHQLTGRAIKVSHDLLEFLDLFKKPISLTTLSEKYTTPDLCSKIDRLCDFQFLLPDNLDEEADWLEKSIIGKNYSLFQSEHFLTHYPGGKGYQARYFTNYMEKALHHLQAKLLGPLNKNCLIYMCNDDVDLLKLWGKPIMPEGVKAFVVKGRILVLNLKEIVYPDQKGSFLFYDMCHEMVHILLAQIVFTLPVWLEEGLCEYFSKPYNHHEFHKKVGRKNVYRISEIELLAKHSLLDLDDSTGNNDILYQQCHSLVTYLARLSGERRLMDCIRHTGLRENFTSLFNNFYGRSLNSVEEEWLEENSLSFDKKTPMIRPSYGRRKEVVKRFTTDKVPGRGRFLHCI